MSMTEPFQPGGHSADEDAVPAAEPGPGGPPPAAAEEPDVLRDADAADPAAAGSLDPAGGDGPFRTPVPGDRLTPDELRGDDAT